MSSFSSQWLPFLVAATIDTHRSNFTIILIQITTTWDAMFITFLIFTHWRKGPAWYIKYSHKFFYAVTVYDFVIQPIFMASLIFVQILNLNSNDSYLDSYLLYMFVVNFLRLIEYLSKVRPLINEGRKTVEQRLEIEGMSDEAVQIEYLRLKADKGVDETARVKMLIEHMSERVSYLDQPRGFGCGELRIGTRIEVDF